VKGWLEAKKGRVGRAKREEGRREGGLLESSTLERRELRRKRAKKRRGGIGQRPRKKGRERREELYTRKEGGGR